MLTIKKHSSYKFCLVQAEGDQRIYLRVQQFGLKEIYD